MLTASCWNSCSLLCTVKRLESKFSSDRQWGIHHNLSFRHDSTFINTIVIWLLSPEKTKSFPLPNDSVRFSVVQRGNYRRSFRSFWSEIESRRRLEKTFRLRKTEIFFAFRRKLLVGIYRFELEQFWRQKRHRTGSRNKSLKSREREAS